MNCVNAASCWKELAGHGTGGIAERDLDFATTTKDASDVVVSGFLIVAIFINLHCFHND